MNFGKALLPRIDAKTAIVMSTGKGDLSRLYRTTDGCQTWKLVFTNPDKDGFFDTLSFLSIEHAPNHQLSVDYANGILLGDPINGEFVIFQTNNGGASWTRRAAQKRTSKGGCQIDTFAAVQGKAAFAASNEALVKFHPYLFFFVTGGMKSRLAYVDHFDLDFSFCHERAKYLDLPLKQGSASAGAFAVAANHTDEAGSYELMIVGGITRTQTLVKEPRHWFLQRFYTFTLSVEGKDHNTRHTGIGVPLLTMMNRRYGSLLDPMVRIFLPTMGRTGGS